ncbi:Cell division protein CrgA [Austwickia sp. TVS 96-490-7B]|uniref:cell division protein CrgA n=1 Tax=Austwickia sp. TVS 96-490-7B TaxID=2830843 RepID=UPI001C566B02|nr:cell division protein CrgA [Austwickia sp. TVS 96-490-7B]MBW3084215.1 Cell division protein CrgA [Austwickia sp. TVS 96-490-7B]
MTESRPAKKTPRPAPTSVRRTVGPKSKKKEASPSWYAPVMLTLMLAGLLWIVVYYLSQGQYPVRSWGNWNLGAGSGLVMAGFLMTTNWR